MQQKGMHHINKACHYELPSALSCTRLAHSAPIPHRRVPSGCSPVRLLTCNVQSAIAMHPICYPSQCSACCCHCCCCWCWAPAIPCRSHLEPSSNEPLEEVYHGVALHSVDDQDVSMAQLDLLLRHVAVLHSSTSQTCDRHCQ